MKCGTRLVTRYFRLVEIMYSKLIHLFCSWRTPRCKNKWITPQSTYCLQTRRLLMTLPCLCEGLHFLYARLKNGTYYAVAMSVRPSVCPSVRPRFSSTCFEISIWNLVYTFSRWHDMSSLSCITIGSFWTSRQPKVGQTHFLQSWRHKSR